MQSSLHLKFNTKTMMLATIAMLLCLSHVPGARGVSIVRPGEDAAVEPTQPALVEVSSMDSLNQTYAHSQLLSRRQGGTAQKNKDFSATLTGKLNREPREYESQKKVEKFFNKDEHAMIMRLTKEVFANLETEMIIVQFVCMEQSFEGHYLYMIDNSGGYNSITARPKHHTASLTSLNWEEMKWGTNVTNYHPDKFGCMYFENPDELETPRLPGRNYKLDGDNLFMCFSKAIPAKGFCKEIKHRKFLSVKSRKWMPAGSLHIANRVENGLCKLKPERLVGFDHHARDENPRVSSQSTAISSIGFNQNFEKTTAMVFHEDFHVDAILGGPSKILRFITGGVPNHTVDTIQFFMDARHFKFNDFTHTDSMQWTVPMIEMFFIMTIGGKEYNRAAMERLPVTFMFVDTKQQDEGKVSSVIWVPNTLVYDIFFPRVSGKLSNKLLRNFDVDKGEWNHGSQI